MVVNSCLDCLEIMSLGIHKDPPIKEVYGNFFITENLDFICDALKKRMCAKNVCDKQSVSVLFTVH